MKTSEIRIRDPFIVTVLDERKYYLYGTTDPGGWQGDIVGFSAYCSTDLEDWEGPFPVFRPSSGFWADRQFWAPEVHVMGGRYFMAATFKAEGVCRGTQILVSDNPLGPFVPHSNGPVTPKDWECLDGTLFWDSSGASWMIFCHEWLQVRDGRIAAVRLTPELCAAVGEPVTLFSASDAKWSNSPTDKKEYVTDGPFLSRASDGSLLMLWSSFHNGQYALGVSRSEQGSVCGPWKHENEPLYSQDGGHGMLFKTFSEQLMLVLHKPNRAPFERALLLPIKEENGRLIIL